MKRQKPTINEEKRFIPSKKSKKEISSSYTYIINGANTDALRPSIEGDYLFNPSYLEKVTTLEVIGDPIKGFDHTKLESSFERVPTQSSINIIFSMHGEVISGKYMLTTRGAGEITYQKGLGTISAAEDTEAGEVITELVKATNYTPLNLFIFSCYGANLQQFLPLLPQKSMIITLSDSDKPTSAFDLCNKTMKATYDELPQEFSIFDLLYIYCISQTYMANTPIIGFFDKAGLPKHLKLSHFVPKIIELREKPSAFLAKLCALNGVTNAHLENLYVQLNHEGAIAALKPPKNLIMEIISAIADELNKIFKQIGIKDPISKYHFISSSNMFIDNGLKGKNYNEDITKLLSLAGEPLKWIKQEWAQKYYFNHEAFLQKVTFKVSDYRQLVEQFFQQESARLLLPTTTNPEEEKWHKTVVERFDSDISEFDYNFPTSLTCVSPNSDYTPSSIPSYSLIMAKSVDAAKRHIQIQTPVQESLLLPYPDDFDITGRLPSSNDSPGLAPTDLSGAYEEYIEF